MRWFGRRAGLLIALSIGAPTAHALDGARAPSQYVIATWGAPQLGSNTVRALVQTRDGYLWLGTGAGLVRYDGARFTLFDARNTPVIGDGGVSALAEGPNGALYFGTTAGAVIQYKDGKFTRVPLRDGTGPVYACLAARDGTLWIGQHGYPIIHWIPGSPAAYFGGETNLISPLAIVEDGDRGLWFGTSDGLVHYDGTIFTRETAMTDAVQALHRDEDGTLWIGTPHGLLTQRAGVLGLFTKRDGLPHDDVSVVTRDRGGNLWVGTREGLARMRDGRFASLTTPLGLSDDDVRALFEDREGNLWVGTANGLTALSDGRFATYGRAEGLPGACLLYTSPSPRDS